MPWYTTSIRCWRLEARSERVMGEGGLKEWLELVRLMITIPSHWVLVVQYICSNQSILYRHIKRIQNVYITSVNLADYLRDKLQEKSPHQTPSCRGTPSRVQDDPTFPSLIDVAVSPTIGHTPPRQVQSRPLLQFHVRGTNLVFYFQNEILRKCIGRFTFKTAPSETSYLLMSAYILLKPL